MDGHCDLSRTACAASVLNRISEGVNDCLAEGQQCLDGAVVLIDRIGKRAVGTDIDLSRSFR